jgi:hypothetical protein
LEEIESSKPTKIQPFIIRDFVAKALSLYGSSLKVARLNDLYSIDEVPAIVQATEKGKIKSKYTAISFDSQKANEEEVEYIGLKHPLVIGLANTVISSCKGSDLSCVAIDQNDSGDSLPFFVKNVDSEVCYNPSRFADSSATTIISKDSSFFKTDAKGGKQWTISPYLDYSSLTDTELANLALNVLISKLPLLLPMEDALNGLATQYVQSRSKGVIDASIESCQKRSQKQLLGLTTRRNQLEGLIYELENNKKLDDKGRAKLSEYRESIKKIDDMLSLMVPKGTDRNCYSYKYSLDKVSFLVIPKAYIEKTPFSETIDKKTEDEKLAIDAVIKTEVSLGFVANDRGEIKGTGYDIISSGIESGKNTIRRIEVKGIQSGCNVVDVTRNEINCSLNTPESFILAIGWVYSDRIELKYIKNPFFKILFKTKGENVDDSIASISFNINSLEKNGDVILSKTIER